MKNENRIVSQIFWIAVIAVFLLSAIPTNALPTPVDVDSNWCKVFEHNQSKDVVYNLGYLEFGEAKIPDGTKRLLGFIRLADEMVGQQPFVVIFNDDNPKPVFNKFYEEVREGKFSATSLNFTDGDHNTKMFIMSPESVYHIAQNYTVRTVIEDGEEKIEVIDGEHIRCLIPLVNTSE